MLPGRLKLAWFRNPIGGYSYINEFLRLGINAESRLHECRVVVPMFLHFMYGGLNQIFGDGVN